MIHKKELEAMEKTFYKEIQDMKELAAARRSYQAHLIEELGRKIVEIESNYMNTNLEDIDFVA